MHCCQFTLTIYWALREHARSMYKEVCAQVRPCDMFSTNELGVITRTACKYIFQKIGAGVYMWVQLLQCKVTPKIVGFFRVSITKRRQNFCPISYQFFIERVL